LERHDYLKARSFEDKKMRKPYITIGGALFLAGFVTTATAPEAQAQFKKITEKEEIEAGRQSAAQAVKEYGAALPASDPRARRVARLGALFAAQSKRRNIPFSYTVLQNDKVLNAFAAPGGPVFVTTKLISTASNDAELAYVLGHETGHIENKHIVTAVQKQQKVGLVAGILGSILSRGKSGNIVGAATGITYNLWQSGYSRDQESDADTYGVRAMSRLGFDPRAAVSMLGKLGGNSSGLSKYLASHPNPETRQKRVTDLINKENLTDVAKRAGGPRLSESSGEQDIYRNTSFNSSADTYSSTPAYSNSNDVSRLDAPLQVVDSGGSRVVLVPVAPLAAYAGGSAKVEAGNAVLVSRGSSSLRLQLGSNEATLNGRRVSLSATPRLIGNRFYAPLGSVAAGLGGSASYDGSRNAVRIDFDGQGGYLALP
jgi:Zn-dependent protease with chaperone function